LSREAVEEVEQLRHELDEERDRRLRLLAEFDNFRRRAARERETAGAEGRRAALRPLLAVLDALERALAAGSSDRDFYDGVAATHRLFVEALRQAGAEPIESVGRTVRSDRARSRRHRARRGRPPGHGRAGSQPRLAVGARAAAPRAGRGDRRRRRASDAWR
jgi:molecular chaperone GrpE